MGDVRQTVDKRIVEQITLNGFNSQLFEWLPAGFIREAADANHPSFDASCFIATENHAGQCRSHFTGNAEKDHVSGSLLE